MGDYADSITKDDKRFDIIGLASWVEKDNIVESQRKWLRELFEPIKKQCVCLLTGNHEETIHASHQNDLVRNLCSDLDVPYGGYHCFVPMQFYRGDADNGTAGSKWTFTIHAWHGAGAAQTEGSRVQRLMRLVNDVVADLYLMGHLHCMTVYTTDRLRCERLRVKSQKVIAATTGAWLKTYNQPDEGQKLSPSYGERAGYKPACIGSPIIRIEPENQTFIIET